MNSFLVSIAYFIELIHVFIKYLQYLIFYDCAKLSSLCHAATKRKEIFSSPVQLGSFIILLRLNGTRN